MTVTVKEKDIENAILAYLATRRDLVPLAWKNQSVGVFDPVKKVYRKSHNKYHLNGVPDILGVLADGRLLAIEVKRPGGRLSEFQKSFLGIASKTGAIAFKASSVQEVCEELAKVAFCLSAKLDEML